MTQSQIAEAVHGLALSGSPVCVHSSLRSFGWVAGGADAVIDAFLAEGCTLIVPTHSYLFAVGPPPGRRPERNGWEHDAVDDWPGAGRVFRPDSIEVSREMGAIPAALLRREGSRRGNHPIDSFAAMGPLAGDLIESQTPDDVHGPLRRLCQLGGHVVMMGVGLDNLTLLHYAEQLAGRNPFIRWANGPDGRVIEVRTGGCSDGFPRLDGILAHLERRVTVGSSQWRVFPAGEAVDAAASSIRREPGITHCDREDCARCRDGVLGGPIG